MTTTSPPAPPGDIHSRQPLMCTLNRGEHLHRFYNIRHDPKYFDRSNSSRFNAPDASFGVLYAAATRDGAFAETLLRAPGRRLLPLDMIAQKAYVRYELTRDLSLIQLAGPGLALVGATAEVCHGDTAYAVTHAWSKALHEHGARCDGIAYMARHDDHAMCVALFDRASGALGPEHRQLDLDTKWFWELADRYGVGIAS